MKHILKSCFELFIIILHKISLSSSINYFYKYFKIIEHVNAQKIQTIFVLSAICCNLILKIIHLTWINFANFTNFQNVLHFNFIVLVDLPKYLIFCIVLNSYTILKMFYLMMFINNSITNQVVKQAIVHNDSSFYLNSFFIFNKKFHKIFKNIFLHDLNAKTIVANIRFFSIIVANLFRIGLISASIKNVSIYCIKINIFSDLCFTEIYFNHFYYFKFNSIYDNWLFSFYTFNFLNSVFNLDFMIYVSSLYSVIGTIIVIISYIKLQQIEQFVLEIKVYELKTTQFVFFQNQNVTSLIWLADINRIYGSVMFLFQIINMPFNPVLLILILNNKLNPRLSFIASLIFMNQICYIFLVSFFAVKLSVKLHKPVKKFIKCSQRLSKNWSFKWRLKLSQYIEYFHTTNLYTVNYGNKGKITYRSCGKVSLL